MKRAEKRERAPAEKRIRGPGLPFRELVGKLFEAGPHPKGPEASKRKRPKGAK